MAFASRQPKSTRVLLVIPDLADGGAQRQCLMLFKELSSTPGVIVGIAYAAEGVNSHLLVRNTNIFRINIRSNYDITAFHQINSIADAFRPDIVYTWLQSADIYGFFLKVTHRKVKWIIAQRNSDHPNDFRFWLRALTGRWADAIVSNSVAGISYWRRRGFKNKTFVAPNIVYPPDVASVENRRDGFFDVICVGRLEPQKNVENVCHAFCRLTLSNEALRFKFVGAGSQYDRLSEIISGYGCSSSVLLPGFSTNVQAEMIAADLLVSVSLREGLPNVLLEALNCGLPIVVSAIPEHIELFGESFKYYVAQYDSVDEIQESILKVLQSGYDYSELSYANERLLGMRPDRVVERYGEIFGKVLSG